ncbi:hypothetical protein NKZ35_25365 [Sinorhizobium meliloti]|uniref:hypothetical protein n=1 Tax=Rhizobium meliloti TaxID=382 RepID=UPI003D662A69
MWKGSLALTLALFLFYSADAKGGDFNQYILKAVEYLNKNHAGGGYDISEAFSHNIDYGGRGTVKATSPKKSMCVAAVSEVIIYATKIYAKETGDNTVFDKVPVSAWTKGNATSLRANIFMFKGTGSRGTGHTLSQYKLGEELRFRDLKPGDFINLNRSSGSGHSVVFIGYLRSDLKVTSNFNTDVVGFQYFSAQGKGRADAGFGYRNAFFGDFCPKKSPVPRDCKVIRSNNRALLNVGRMWDPPQWKYLDAIKERRISTRSIFEDQNPELSRAVIDQLVDDFLKEELSMSPVQANKFDGVTTD